MKLRINAKLRAALIAAIATVGFTLPQSQAADVVQWTSTFNVTGTGVGEWTASETSAVDLAASNWSLTKITNGDGVGNKPASDGQLRPDTNVQNASGWILSFDITNGGEAAQTLSAVSLDSFLFNGGNSYQNNGTDRKFQVTLSYGDPSQSVNTGEFTIHGKGNAHPDNGVVNVAFAEAVTLGSTQSLHISVAFDKTTETSGCFVGLNGISLLYTPTAVTSTWKGTEGDNNWTSTTAWDTPISPESSIVNFDGTAANKTAVVDAASSVDKIEVSGDTHTFQLDNALTTGSLTIEETGALVLSGEKMLAVTGGFDIADGASLTVGEGASLKVASGQKDLMMGTAVTNNGTFVLTSNVSIGNGESTAMTGTLAIQGATVTLGSGEGTTASIASYSHVTLDGGQITVNAQNATVNGVSVAAGKTGTVKVEDMKNSPNTVTLAGITQVDGTLNLTNNWNSSFTIEQLSGAGTLNQPAGGAQEMLLTINSLKDFTGSMVLKHDKGGDAININTGTTAVNFNTLELAIGSHTANFTLGADTGIALAKLTSGTLALSGADTYTLTLGGLEGGATITGLDDLTLNVAEGTHVYTGALTVAGQITKTGAGSQTISGTALHHTILAQEGKLVLNGTYAIDDVAEGAQVAKIVDYEDHDSDNGFRMITGSKIVYSDAGTVLDLTNAHFTYQTQDVTQSVVDNSGAFALPGDSIKSTVYVTKDSLDIANYKNVAGDALTSVELSDGTTVNMDAAVTVGVKLVEGASATVNAAEATTLSGVTGLGEGQTLTITGTAPVTIGSAITGSTVSVNGGTLNLGNYIHNLAALSVVNGTVTAVGVDSGNGCVSGTISIGADGVFQTTGHHDVFGYNNNATDKIVMGGTGSDHMASLELTPDGTGVTTMTTDIEMNGYAAITTKNGFNTYNGAITATGVENSIDQMYLRSSVTITVNGAESELTIGKLKRTNNFDGTITKEGAGKLVFNGEENVIDKTITVNAGTLALDGTFSIGGIQGTESATYDGGLVKDNGFKTATTTRTVYTKGGEGANVIVGQDAHFMVGEDEVQLADDGTYTSAAETDYTKFYVNSESEAVSTALVGHQPTAFALAASTTLQVDQSIAATVTGADATSVVSIGSDKVLTGTAQNVTIAGSGTYVLNNATSSLGTGVALANDWTGIVSVIGANYSGAFSTGLSHEGSWIELKGTKGYLTNQTITNDIILSRGEDDWAFQQNNGNNGHVIVFAGTLVGDGNLGRGNGVGSTYTYEFTGDISEWTGQFISRNNNNNSTTFKLSAAEAMEVGATLVNKGTDFYVAVNTDATFNAGVEATKVTVAEGKTATFTGETTIGTIEGPGSVVVGGGATLTVTGSVAEGVQIEAKDGATIAGDGIDASQVGIAAEGGTATFADGIAQESGISFSEGAVVTNNGGEAAAYDTSKETMAVVAGEVTFEGAEALTVANDLTVVSIVNDGTAALTLTKVDGEALESIQANNADVTVHNVAATELSYLVIGKGKTVSVYADETAAVEGTVTIADALVAGGGTLYADLTLVGHELGDQTPLLYWDLNGAGQENALTLGSTLTLNTDTGLIQLDDVTMQAIADLGNRGEFLELVLNGGEPGTLGYQGKEWFDGVFSRTYINAEGVESTLGGDYNVQLLENGNFGIVKFSDTPEPTTGTLSLLALAALAARRRRH